MLKDTYGSRSLQAPISVSVLDVCGRLQVSIEEILLIFSVLISAAYVSNGYPEEKDKGFWRAMQWSGNITGATIGGCVALG